MMSPSDGATDVLVDSAVEVLFTEPMNPASFTNASFTLFHGSNQIACTIFADANRAKLTPNQPLEFATLYHVSLKTSIQDAAGRPLEKEQGWIFVTEQNIAPQVESTQPPDKLQNASLDSAIQAVFSRAMDPSTINGDTFQLILLKDQQGEQNRQIAGTISYSEKTAEFVSGEPFHELGLYRVSLNDQVRDTQGHRLVAHTWEFTMTETVAPFITDQFPTAVETEADPGVTVSATFSEDLSPASIKDASFVLRDENGALVTATTIYDNNRKIFSLKPAQLLELGSSYKAEAAKELRDLAGNWLSEDSDQRALKRIWSFRTTDSCGNPYLVKGPITSASPEVQIGVDGAGNIFVVWKERNPNVLSLFVARYDAQSGLWKEPVLVEEDDSSNVSSPRLAVSPQGDAVVVWLQKVDENGDGDLSNDHTSVYARRYNPAVVKEDKRWGKVTLLENYTTIEATSPALAIDAAGNAIAVWQQNFSPMTNLLARRSHFDASTQKWIWEVVTVLDTSDDSDASSPKIAMNPAGDAIVLFRQKIDVEGDGIDNNKISILAENYSSASNTWSASNSFVETDESGDATDPEVAMDALGNAIVIWKQETADTNGDGIVNGLDKASLLASPGNGGVWATPVRLDDPFIAEEPTNHSIAMDALGNALVSWQQRPYEGAALDLSSIRYSAATSKWDTATLLVESLPGDAQNILLMAGLPSNFLGVWEQKTDSNHDGTIDAQDKLSVFTNHYNIGTGSWAKKACLLEKQDEADVRLSGMGVDPGGKVVAAWSQGTGTPEVWISRSN